MYLISLYFDEGTNKKIQLYMEQIAQRTGNMAMIDGKVPPHITLSAFDMAEEEKAIAGFTAMEQEFEKGQIFWCSVGMLSLIHIFPAKLFKDHRVCRVSSKAAGCECIYCNSDERSKRGYDRYPDAGGSGSSNDRLRQTESVPCGTVSKE